MHMANESWHDGVDILSYEFIWRKLKNIGSLWSTSLNNTYIASLTWYYDGARNGIFWVFFSLLLTWDLDRTNKFFLDHVKMASIFQN